MARRICSRCVNVCNSGPHDRSVQELPELLLGYGAAETEEEAADTCKAIAAALKDAKLVQSEVGDEEFDVRAAAKQSGGIQRLAEAVTTVHRQLHVSCDYRWT